MKTPITKLMPNRPFLSCLLPLFRNESFCKTLQNYESELDLHENEPAGETHFHMNSFAQIHSDTEAKSILGIANSSYELEPLNELIT